MPTTGRPRHRVPARLQVGSALALMALARATALAQSPAPEPPPAPMDTAPADTVPADTGQPSAPPAVPIPLLPPPVTVEPPLPPATAEAPPPAITPVPPPAPNVPAARPRALPALPTTTATGASTGAPATLFDGHSPVPVTVLDRELLQAAGTASLGQALQQLSWQSNAINTQFNEGGDGSTRIALRGLGADRTLVLINGRRHVHGGTGADASVDLEAIPLALVERVEIVRGPAGVHGLDALAGVVNIITRQELDGVDAALFAGSTPDGLGQTYDASAAVGQRFERGRAITAVGYYQQQSILGADREFGRFDRQYDWATGQVTELGSTATPHGAIVDYGEGEGNQAWQELVARNADARMYYNDPEAGWRAFRETGNSDSGEGDYYNYARQSFLVTPLERYHVFAAGDYQLGDRLRAFAEASYVNRRSEQQHAPYALFTSSEGVVVSADNVYNPFGRDFIDMRRRMREVGNLRSQQDVDTMRLVAGLDGSLPIALGTQAPWRWRASYGYGATSGTQTFQNRLRRDRLQAALGPSFLDADGTARCGTPDAPIVGCVPLDLFGGSYSITPLMQRYLVHTYVDRGRNEQSWLAVDAGGDLVRTSSGAGASLTIGADYRDESGSITFDPVDATGSRSAPLDGSYDVRGVHASLSVIPFMNRAAGHAVELQAAASVFDLGASGMGSTWHIAGIARMGQGPGIRISLGRAMGAPSIAELFGQAAEAFPPLRDPCSDTLSSPRSPNARFNCSADGVPDDFVDNRAQLRTLQGGGNPALRPESAASATFGLVFAPRAVPGLSLSLDGFAIIVVDEIGPLGASYILQSCYESDPDARSHCDQIVRDPATGLVEVIIDSQANRGSRATAGSDVQISHDSDTVLGRLRLRLRSTRLMLFATADADGEVIHVGQGVYDLGVHPAYRHDASVLWSRGMLGAGAQVRYVGSFFECEDNDCQLGRDQGFPPIARQVESYFTADVHGSITVDSGLGQTMITVGVRNLLDRQPPAIYSGGQANSDPSTYDYTGRFAYLRLTQRF